MSGFRAKMLFGLLFAALCQLTQAATYHCIGSGDANALKGALAVAESAADTTVIELQQGTYNISAFSYNPHAALKLLGGYAPGDSSCSSRTLDAQNTVLDGSGVAWRLFMQGSITIEGVTFQHFSQNTFSLFMDHINSTNTTIFNNRFSGTRLDVEYACSDESAILVSNNLIDRSPIDGMMVSTWCDSLSTGTLHTTGLTSIIITGNTVGNSAGRGIVVQTSATAELHNNIAYSYFSSSDDIHLQTGDLTHDDTAFSALLDHNLYRSSYGNGTSGSGGNVSSGPLWVNGGSGDYHLQSGSSAINAGNPSAPGQTSEDLDGDDRAGGAARVIGSAPDIGAYESNVNDLASVTLTVTSAANGSAGDNCSSGSSTCTLRQAINDANASGGTHYIEFSIPGSCPQVINLDSDLPYVTTSGLSINGFTQPGSKPNNYPDGDIARRCIVLNGEGRGSNMGLTFYGASSGFYWVQGLAFEGWFIGLNMSAGQNNLVWGNQFGGSLWYPSAMSLSANNIDIWLWGSGTTTSVGGTDPSNRNVIDSAAYDPAIGYSGSGIAISSDGTNDSNGNSIINNIIGLDGFESTAYGNGVGIQLETANNVISGNVIGNNNNGIQVRGIGASDNRIRENRIGLTEPPLCFGSCPSYYTEPNQAAIYFWQGANGNFVYSNIITGNSLFGIELTGAGTVRNDVYANSIYGNSANWAANGAQVNLDSYSYSYNDPGSTAPNRGLNYPIIESASGSGTRGTLVGHLASSNGTYSIEVFSSPTCEAGGAYAHPPFGSTIISNATTGTNGTGGFYFDFTSPSSMSLSGRYITAIAIDSNHNSSEFSACKPYQCDVIFRHSFDGSTGEKCP